MAVRIAIAAVAAAVALGVTGPVSAQAPEQLLPEGPGREAVIRVCTACHEATQFAAARFTPEGWDREISKMQSAGAEMTAEEQTAISTYLGKYLAAPAPAAP